jgi:hypothetical protein
LPVGHTHEDIDGCFGTIAQWFTKTIIHTPKEYKTSIEKAFEGGEYSKLKCRVVDVFVVPDYQSFFGSSIDPYFGRLHKLKWTQHQYRFEAVTISELFPNGAKFTYRKYSSDKVVLIEKRPPFLCKHSLGKLTGQIFFNLLAQRRNDRLIIDNVKFRTRATNCFITVVPYSGTLSES